MDRTKTMNAVKVRLDGELRSLDAQIAHLTTRRNAEIAAIDAHINKLTEQRAKLAGEVAGMSEAIREVK